MSARRLKAEDADKTPLPTLADFARALDELRKIAASGPVKSFSFKRLAVLEQRFNLHVLLNGWRELAAQKSVPHRDFYNVRKVDTHVHHSARGVRAARALYPSRGRCQSSNAADVLHADGAVTPTPETGFVRIRSRNGRRPRVGVAAGA